MNGLKFAYAITFYQYFIFLLQTNFGWLLENGASRSQGAALIPLLGPLCFRMLTKWKNMIFFHPSCQMFERSQVESLGAVQDIPSHSAEGWAFALTLFHVMTPTMLLISLFFWKCQFFALSTINTTPSKFFLYLALLVFPNLMCSSRVHEKRPLKELCGLGQLKGLVFSAAPNGLAHLTFHFLLY